MRKRMNLFLKLITPFNERNKMTYYDYDYQIKIQEDTINKYLDNKNFHKVGMEYVDSNRYSSEEDISTLEFEDYSKSSWNKDKDDYEHSLSVHRNFISNVELSDLTEMMIKIEDHINENVEINNDIPQVKRCMKSLVRIVHRFNYTRGHDIPVSETNHSRDPKSVW